MTTPTARPRFEERLLHQLQQVVAQTPAPAVVAAAPAHARTRPTRLAISGAALAAALAATVILATSGDGPTSAYAVQSQADGTVEVTINDLRDADGLQQKLRAAGIPAVVTFVAGHELCRATPPNGEPGVLHRSLEGENGGPALSIAGGADAAAPHGGEVKMGVRIHHDAGGATSATFMLDPDQFKPGQTLMLAASGGALGSLAMQVVTDADHKAPIPACVP